MICYVIWKRCSNWLTQNTSFIFEMRMRARLNFNRDEISISIIMNWIFKRPQWVHHSTTCMNHHYCYCTLNKNEWNRRAGRQTGWLSGWLAGKKSSRNKSPMESYKLITMLWFNIVSKSCATTIAASNLNRIHGSGDSNNGPKKSTKRFHKHHISSCRFKLQIYVLYSTYRWQTPNWKRNVSRTLNTHSIC